MAEPGAFYDLHIKRYMHGTKGLCSSRLKTVRRRMLQRLSTLICVHNARDTIEPEAAEGK